MALIEVLVLGLAVYRIWRLLGADTILDPLRNRIGSPWIMDLITCPWCLGSWLAIIAGLLTNEYGLTQTSPWLLIPAAATVVGLLGKLDS